MMIMIMIGVGGGDYDYDDYDYDKNSIISYECFYECNDHQLFYIK